MDLDLADLDADAVLDVFLLRVGRQEAPGLERAADLREVLPGGLPRRAAHMQDLEAGAMEDCKRQCGAESPDTFRRKICRQ